MKYADHARLWRLVEGAVVDAIQSHPDYLTPKGERNAARSITKRVVGQIVGQAKEALRRGGLGHCPADGADQPHPEWSGTTTDHGAGVAKAPAPQSP